MRVPPPGRRVTYSPTRATTSVASRSSAIDSSRMRPATADFTSTLRRNSKGRTRRVTGIVRTAPDGGSAVAGPVAEAIPAVEPGLDRFGGERRLPGGQGVAVGHAGDGVDGLL